MNSSKRRVELYDTTLRDGTQGAGVSLSLVDKIELTRLLDQAGFDYVEGGYPLSNPKDAAYFEKVRGLALRHAKVVAFGMTRRRGVAAAEDEGMRALVAAGTPVIAIVGKTWDLHVKEVLRVSEEENLAMIEDSVRHCVEAPGVEAVFYDAEHFFDGWNANRAYALETLRAAARGGASRLVLCDTNGGSLPGFIAEAVAAAEEAVAAEFPGLRGGVAIHPHNDAGLAVANALSAVAAGAVQVQGTINGIGERCGNVDLITVAANLVFKLGHDCLRPGALAGLRTLSRAVDARAQLAPQPGQPWVGDNAFTHKGGMHVHAVQRIAHSYEHADPASVGNQRRILVSELSGASNIAATLGARLGIDADRPLQRQLLERVQDLEHAGYQFENAQASLELLARGLMGQRVDFWTLDHYRCIIHRRGGRAGGPPGGINTEAVVRMTIDGVEEHRVAGGDGPINALDGALRKCLRDHHPGIDRLHLADFSVRAVNPTAESAAKVRVVIRFDVRGGGDDASFGTTGVNENIVDACFEALSDAFRHFLADQASRPA
ncbi:citramalate synthase [Phycisphaera mikurensis]|uniref:Citramalate synthase n=1 Tax=Phycisphaera mikurensis (strain NBRC 102666 / KCTC 22515 / FYK2301M01) TaxID=1142394 RepID=I0IH39_PHYMF|nr:citramalate synthase [Phycisphaera mikurensis]MBB6440831.1 2-isopropylmalate synthase [Phycisphaera mikurensis]BAM04577.1 putative 2-isopropylmalate synthase/homocitrate synthase family protein [Phycisphaera mikurensis NBRC 102666]